MASLIKFQGTQVKENGPYTLPRKNVLIKEFQGYTGTKQSVAVQVHCNFKCKQELSAFQQKLTLCGTCEDDILGVATNSGGTITLHQPRI